MTLTNEQIERVLFQLKGIVTPTWYERQAAEGLTELLALRAEVERLKRPLSEAAATAVVGIVNDIDQRNGLDGAWYGIGHDTRGEIEAEWTRIIAEAFSKLTGARRGE